MNEDAHELRIQYQLTTLLMYTLQRCRIPIWSLSYTRLYHGCCTACIMVVAQQVLRLVQAERAGVKMLSCISVQ